MTTRTATLNNGQTIPLLGMGCWMSQPVEAENQETYDLVAEALRAGYRHIDTAALYGNEQAVGKAIRDSNVARSEIFLTTKLPNKAHGTVLETFETSLISLGADYVDLYLMHWPQAKDENDEWVPKGQDPTFVQTWKDMEKLLEGGKVRSIGVSNFSTKNLDILLKEASVVPAVNQVEANTYHPQTSLSAYCAEKNIHLTAYCPLGQPLPGVGSPVLNDPLLIKLGDKYGKTPAAILLSWHLQRGNWSAVPKSANPKRMRDNADVVDLDQADFDALSNLHKEEGKLLVSCSYNQGDIYKTKHIYGWSLEDMGWEILD